MYCVQKRVPSELRPLLGKGIREISLRTKDPTEAKARFPEAHRRLRNDWQALCSCVRRHAAYGAGPVAARTIVEMPHRSGKLRIGV